MNKSNTEYSINSRAKVNLFLQILNKRNDGYHNINSLFSELHFGDTLHFKPAENYSLTVKGLKVPTDETNLISKAYHLIRDKVKKQVIAYKIKLCKFIPIGSGLGGGSSNAATTIIALNQLWKLNMSKNKLESIGKKLGADVPFFIKGGTQQAEGIGNILKNQPDFLIDETTFLLIIPPLNISTEWAYSKLNNYLELDANRSRFAIPLKPIKWKLFKNDFEGLIVSTYPEIGKIKKTLIASGADFASLSGSGSTVFGIYKNKQRAQKAKKLFTNYQTIITHPNKRK